MTAFAAASPQYDTIRDSPGGEKVVFVNRPTLGGDGRMELMVTVAVNVLNSSKLDGQEIDRRGDSA